MSSQKDIAIKISNVSKSFKLPHEKNTSVKSFFVNPFKKRTFEKQEVLKNINFEIEKGDFFGIVGRNGSGKSTLLKLLAGIYSPNEGHISVHGKLTPFIELGVGFNPELTGRENVFLNGALLGFNRKEMNVLYEEIVEFAELEKFMDQKLKNYSSGMQVRLAFSIAIRANSDILVLDEVLAVGDANFQKKCYDYFIEIKKAGKTVILVTHDMSAVNQFCTKAILIDKGIASEVMKPSDASIAYQEQNFNTDNNDKNEKKIRWGTKKVEIDKVELNKKNKFNIGDSLELKIKLKPNEKKKIIIGLAFIDQYGTNLSGPNSKKQAFYSDDEISYTINNISFSPGAYTVTVAVFDENVNEEYDHIENAVNFNVISKEEIFGKFKLDDNWRIGK